MSESRISPGTRNSSAAITFIRFSGGVSAIDDSSYILPKTVFNKSSIVTIPETAPCSLRQIATSLFVFLNCIKSSSAVRDSGKKRGGILFFKINSSEFKFSGANKRLL